MKVHAMPFDVEAFGVDLLLLFGKKGVFRQWALIYSTF
jgi:hypothetical protein